MYLDAYPGINQLLAGLQHNYQLVALTNTNSIHNNVWPSKYADTLQYFEKVFSSHELKERKPAAAVYQAVLDYLRVKPSQTIFLDDSIENINGAGQLGIKTILVTSYAQMVADLQANGVVV